MAKHPEDTSLTDNEKRAAAHRAEIDTQQRAARERAQRENEPFTPRSDPFVPTASVKPDTPVKPPPVQVATTSPAPVPLGAVPNIQRYDDGKSPRDIGLSDANSDALIGAGLGSVGRIRRVRDVDLKAIDGVNRGNVREKVPFGCLAHETVLVPVEDKPGEWVDGPDRENRAR